MLSQIIYKVTEGSELSFLLCASPSTPPLVRCITLLVRVTNPVLLNLTTDCPCSGTPNDGFFFSRWINSCVVHQVSLCQVVWWAGCRGATVQIFWGSRGLSIHILVLTWAPLGMPHAQIMCICLLCLNPWRTHCTFLSCLLVLGREQLRHLNIQPAKGMSVWQQSTWQPGPVSSHSHPKGCPTDGKLGVSLQTALLLLHQEPLKGVKWCLTERTKTAEEIIRN